MHTKLIRNLRPGDRVILRGIHPTQLCEVSVAAPPRKVRSYFTSRQRYEVDLVDAPWWWGDKLHGDSRERVGVASR